MEIKEKRKPGRPRKKPIKESPKKKGIIQTPEIKDVIVEFNYDKPANLKKLTQFWASLNAEKIAIVFDHEKAIFYTKNFKDMNYIKCTLDGSKIISYYGPPQGLSMLVMFIDIELAFQKLDKSYETICFIVSKSTNKINLILKNEFNITEYIEIDSVPDNKYEKQFELQFKNNINYPLEFKLPGKFFKRTINDAKAYGNSWAIEKYGTTGNLTFTYQNENKRVKSTSVPDSNDPIVKNNIANDEIFSVSVFVDGIKPASSSQLADTIYFKASREDPLCVFVSIDEALSVDMRIQIVNYKPNSN